MSVSNKLPKGLQSHHESVAVSQRVAALSLLNYTNYYTNTGKFG
jgi:hypothetical protein